MTADIPAGYKLIFEEDFADPKSLARFALLDPAVWRRTTVAGRPVLEQFRDYKETSYQPPYRSPFTYCLLTGPAVGDFVLEVDCQNTHRDDPHRDMVFVWGWQSATRFYYAHVATRTDAVAHTILVVDEAPRVKLPTAVGTTGVDWGRDAWRTVRVVRTLANGKMAVHFDDPAKPVLTATDKRFGVGRVGFGTFDDTCRVRAVKLWSPAAVERPPATFPRK